MDTPGIVSTNELKRYNLTSSFKNDANISLRTADIIGLIQDTENIFTRNKIHPNIFELLKDMEHKIPMILILNKVDKVKKKESLLQLVTVLTKAKDSLRFADVFMISALTGNGVDDLRVSYCKKRYFKCVCYRDFNNDV